MAAQADAARFDLGRVLSRTTGTIGRNIGLLAILAVVFEFFPALLVRVIASATAGPLSPRGLPSFTAINGIGMLVTIACFCVMLGAIIRIVIVDQQGARPDIGAVLTLALQRWVPMFVMFVVMYVAVVFGMLLFIVPGVILALMWTVAAPVLVEENAGIFGSLGRSRALTKGARGSIFLLLLALVLFQLLVLAALVLVAGTYSSVSGAGWFMGAVVATGQGFGALAIAYMVASVALSIVFTVLIAAIYVELRFVREGDRPESLAEVFA